MHIVAAQHSIFLIHWVISSQGDFQSPVLIRLTMVLNNVAVLVATTLCSSASAVVAQRAVNLLKVVGAQYTSRHISIVKNLIPMSTQFCGDKCSKCLPHSATYVVARYKIIIFFLYSLLGLRRLCWHNFGHNGH